MGFFLWALYISAIAPEAAVSRLCTGRLQSPNSDFSGIPQMQAALVNALSKDRLLHQPLVKRKCSGYQACVCAPARRRQRGC